MATLRIHGTAIFKRKYLASRNVGPVISEGWGIFKRTHQETETKPLIERSDLEFKNLEIDLDLDSLKNFCSDKRCNSLNEFVSSELFTIYLYDNHGISLWCKQLIHQAPWDCFGEELEGTGDDFLDMSCIEDQRAHFYSDYEPGECPEEEQEFLASISPENFQILLHDQCLLELDGTSFSRDSAENWEIWESGSIVVAGQQLYGHPAFLGFSRKQHLDAQLYIQGTDSNLVDERTLFATADQISEVEFVKDIEDLVPESEDVMKRETSHSPKQTLEQKRSAWEE